MKQKNLKKHKICDEIKGNVKKPKVEIGQCYKWRDKIFMVLRKAPFKNRWVIQDTLTKYEGIVFASQLINMRRPFQNYG